MDFPKKELLKFCWPSDYSISNLENGAIFCQHYSAYNDPFEFWSNIYDGIPDAGKEPERFAAALAAWGMSGTSPDDEDLIAYFDECQNYQPPFKEMRDEVRIACFGSQRENLLMWSHYADGLRGFCIVFDEDAVVKSEPQAYLLDVEYINVPPTLDSFVYAIAHDQEWYHQVAIEETETRIKYLGKTNEKGWITTYEKAGAAAVAKMREIWQYVFAVKPSEWSYEHERRLLVPTRCCDKEPIMRSFSTDAIKEIILGERMSDDFREKLLSVLDKSYPGVPIRTAHRAQNLYTINIC
ncbi:MAG: hypothetical protein CL578_18595 [Alteromonadaceae bacterium]|jgi:hypothetical protein|uniref:DUF2971 domain-containing protein n=1 Tax=unclassified Methylophaga TaxID=2629249 RepID=UPI000C3CD7B2|nr:MULTISPECIES: DUF2971 domain-containing protein [unclassified Methylophaga]MAP25492.1 hypothetical protein [Methylophaga sp.]MBN27038.1 hypothetical protein [Alteromonadaceae bacterium]|tara:strand:+ start:24949 stop:25836 length:888 start_codon:yes stop_codon:yes gene_type:complete